MGDVLASVKLKRDCKGFKKNDIVQVKLIQLYDDQFAVIFNGRRYDLKREDFEKVSD